MLWRKCRFRLKGHVMSEAQRPGRQENGQTEGRKLSPEARRALAEAEGRRREAAGKPDLPPEFNGPAGPEPIRYGDWERKGIASDF
jgi:hypothetical protein